MESQDLSLDMTSDNTAPGRPDNDASLEEALATHEAQVDALIRAGSKYLSALKSWKKAVAKGDIAARQKAADQAMEAAQALPGGTSETAAAWQFDVYAYLSSSAWQHELRTLASGEKFGLRILLEGNMAISSPVLLQALPSRGILQIGKKLFRSIRPKVVAAELKRLRDKANTGGQQQFLEFLYGGVEYLSKDSGAFFAKFRGLYDLFCLSPGYKKDNPKSAFGQEIYALHRSGISATKAGKRYDFEYPSSSAKESDIFEVVSEDGRPLRYYGITFR
ncbi:MAG: hypothetical protein IT209_00905 [Armatimonadetes bacterium]|nr:hypothetical protein [Armatimonadota bacterium]